MNDAAVLTQELASQVQNKLSEPKPKLDPSKSKEIYTAFFHEGPIRREYRFYAPAPDLSIEDEEKRHRDRQARIWRLCKRYERYLKSIENRKVTFVGVPQPFVIDLEAKMADFESKIAKNEHI